MELSYPLKYLSHFIQGIKLSVEDITTLVPNANTTNSEPNISSSGPLVTFEHKTNSQVSLFYGTKLSNIHFILHFLVFFIH
jgi:hypothetical protein